MDCVIEDRPSYTPEERAADLAALRALTRKLHRQQRAVEVTSDQRLVIVCRLRAGGATYPELATAMGATYSAVQRLLERIDRDKETEQ